jgi:hypothetical protein
VNVDYIGLRLVEQPPYCAPLDVSVPVHVASPPHRQFLDTKRLYPERRFCPGVGPGAGHHQRDIDSLRYQGSLASPMLGISATVVNAQNSNRWHR